MADDDLDRWARQLADAAGGELRRVLVRGARELALYGERQVKLYATERPKVRSRHLRASSGVDLRPTQGGLDLVVRAGGGQKNVRYAKLQEEGGTVSAKPDKFLAVPLPAALTKAGVTRGKYAVPGGLRNVPGLFPITSKRGNHLLVERTKGGALRVLFALVKSVTIRPTHFLARARADMLARLPAVYGDALDVVTEVP